MKTTLNFTPPSLAGLESGVHIEVIPVSVVNPSLSKAIRCGQRSEDSLSAYGTVTPFPSL